MNVLAETSDAVQITTLITGAVTAISLPFIAYLMARLNAKQAKAAIAVESVREQLKMTNTIADDKLNSIASTADDVLQRVNGGMKTQLEINSRAANTLAVITNEKSHKEAARAADAALAAHMKTDAEIKDRHAEEAHLIISQE